MIYLPQNDRRDRTQSTTALFNYLYKGRKPATPPGPTPAPTNATGPSSMPMTGLQQRDYGLPAVDSNAPPLDFGPDPNTNPTQPPRDPTQPPSFNPTAVQAAAPASTPGLDIDNSTQPTDKASKALSAFSVIAPLFGAAAAATGGGGGGGGGASNGSIAKPAGTPKQGGGLCGKGKK